MNYHECFDWVAWEAFIRWALHCLASLTHDKMTQAQRKYKKMITPMLPGRDSEILNLMWRHTSSHIQMSGSVTPATSQRCDLTPALHLQTLSNAFRVHQSTCHYWLLYQLFSAICDLFPTNHHQKTKIQWFLLRRASVGKKVSQFAHLKCWWNR